mmetsp:Transcript_4612/g.10495  ORF Transcript_4612/g.10495 Transcript_4612/m.10495 type:complete len:276 (-) Transcript_4612:543-1370(-)
MTSCSTGPSRRPSLSSGRAAACCTTERRQRAERARGARPSRHCHRTRAARPRVPSPSAPRRRLPSAQLLLPSGLPWMRSSPSSTPRTKWASGRELLLLSLLLLLLLLFLLLLSLLLFLPFLLLSLLLLSLILICGRLAPRLCTLSPPWTTWTGARTKAGAGWKRCLPLGARGMQRNSGRSSRGRGRAVRAVSARTTLSRTWASRTTTMSGRWLQACAPRRLPSPPRSSLCPPGSLGVSAPAPSAAYLSPALPLVSSAPAAVAPPTPTPRPRCLRS